MKFGRLAAGVAVAILTGCSSGVDTSSMNQPAAAPSVAAAPPAATPAGSWPVGIDPSLNPADPVHFSGLWTQGDPAYCCWIAQRGLLKITTPGTKKTIVFHVVVPDAPVLRDGKQGLTIRFPGMAPQTHSDLLPGEHDLAYTLPPATVAKAETVPIAFQASTYFVPVKSGWGTDTRQISLMLKSVTYR